MEHETTTAAPLATDIELYLADLQAVIGRDQMTMWPSHKVRYLLSDPDSVERNHREDREALRRHVYDVVSGQCAACNVAFPCAEVRAVARRRGRTAQVDREGLLAQHAASAHGVCAVCDHDATRYDESPPKFPCRTATRRDAQQRRPPTQRR